MITGVLYIVGYSDYRSVFLKCMYLKMCCTMMTRVFYNVHIWKCSVQSSCRPIWKCVVGWLQGSSRGKTRGPCCLWAMLRSDWPRVITILMMIWWWWRDPGEDCDGIEKDDCKSEDGGKVELKNNMNENLVLKQVEVTMSKPNRIDHPGVIWWRWWQWWWWLWWWLQRW